MIMALVCLVRFEHVVRRDRAKWLAPIGAIIGLEMGFSSAGAGAIGALAMMSLTKLATVEIVGTGLGFGLALSALGGLIHAGMGDVNTAVLWKLLVGGALGALAGSAVAGRVPAKQLRFVLCLTLVYIGGQLSWKTFSGMPGIGATVLPATVFGLVAAAAIWGLLAYFRPAKGAQNTLAENMPHASSRAAGK
jgi:uncharacterized membrane protein YfcA